MKRVFEIKIDYFKPSGKWYTDHKVYLPFTDTASTNMSDVYEEEYRAQGLLDDLEHAICPPNCAMYEVTQWVRKCRENGMLPGIGSWKGPILVNCRDGYPCLVMPDDGVAR